jgi:hypothetical protein
MRKTRVLWLSVPLAPSLLLGVIVTSVGAPPDSVEGGASGATIHSGNTRVGPTPQVVLPRHGGAASTEVPELNVPNVVSTGTLTAMSGGATDSGDTSAQSISTIENVSLLGGRIRADLVVAIASSAGDGLAATSNAAGSEVVNLVVDGVSRGSVSGSNVGIPIARGTVVVNEQVVGGDGSSTSSIAVNALRVILRDPMTWAITDDIKIGSASSGVVATPFIPAHPLPEVCVFYTGGGRIDRLPHQGNQDFATFGFNATMRNTADCKGPAGQLQYVDHFRRFKFHGTSADIVGESDDFEFGGKCAEISGTGRFSLDNGPWTDSSYRAMVCDNGEPGVGRDKFMIEVSAGYSSLGEGKGPVLKGGNIQRHG